MELKIDINDFCKNYKDNGLDEIIAQLFEKYEVTLVLTFDKEGSKKQFFLTDEWLGKSYYTKIEYNKKGGSIYFSNDNVEGKLELINSPIATFMHGVYGLLENKPIIN